MRFGLEWRARLLPYNAAYGRRTEAGYVKLDIVRGSIHDSGALTSAMRSHL